MECVRLRYYSIDGEDSSVFKQHYIRHTERTVHSFVVPESGSHLSICSEAAKFLTASWDWKHFRSSYLIHPYAACQYLWIAIPYLLQVAIDQLALNIWSVGMLQFDYIVDKLEIVSRPEVPAVHTVCFY